jgi:hypothetical protein
MLHKELFRDVTSSFLRHRKNLSEYELLSDFALTAYNEFYIVSELKSEKEEKL